MEEMSDRVPETAARPPWAATMGITAKALGLAAMAVLACRPAEAQGGRYRGPAGVVPPGLREPGDPVPPPPSPPGSFVSHPSPHARIPTSFDQWVFWWAYNADAVVPPRRRASQADPT